MQGPAITTASQTTPLNVLVVEDSETSAESMATFLRMAGFGVAIAQDGPEAVRAAQEVRPDVVLLDIGLPGMSGYEVARRLQEQTGEKLPLLIAVTGHGEDDDRQHSTEVGIHLHLVKPVNAGQLLSVLTRFRDILGK